MESIQNKLSQLILKEKIKPHRLTENVMVSLMMTIKDLNCYPIPEIVLCFTIFNIIRIVLHTYYNKLEPNNTKLMSTRNVKAEWSKILGFSITECDELINEVKSHNVFAPSHNLEEEFTIFFEDYNHDETDEIAELNRKLIIPNKIKVAEIFNKLIHTLNVEYIVPKFTKLKIRLTDGCGKFVESKCTIIEKRLESNLVIISVKKCIEARISFIFDILYENNPWDMFENSNIIEKGIIYSDLYIRVCYNHTKNRLEIETEQLNRPIEEVVRFLQNHPKIKNKLHST
ncbi:dihydroxy-acid dehydratase [Callinectes sapidus nudivirus]|nr:dihydroxy-acid dehydratase [Callinectes sapidus nudivirus]